MVTAVETARPRDGEPAHRSYDILDVARLGQGHWTFAASVPHDSATWPFLVFHPFRGRASVTQSASDVSIGEEDFLLLRHSSSLDVLAGPECDLLVVRIAGSTVGPYSQSMAAALGRRISTRNGTASLVAHLLEGLAAQPADYTPQNPAGLAQHIVGLVALMCIDEGVGGRLTMLQRAKEYIEVHLGDLDLTPDSIAAAQNISTRTLHRLFEGEGLTISGWTRSRRLEHCRIELGDSGFEDLAISSIGARWGLWDAAHFSRLFKSSFGMSPRAYRGAALARKDGSAAVHRESPGESFCQLKRGGR